MKILGIYPQGAYVAPSGDKEWTEPLGLEYILTQAATQGHEVGLITMIDLSEAELICEAIRQKPDMIALSAMTCQIPCAMRVAEKIKTQLPECKIALGGYHPSAIKDTPESMSDIVDYWVIGEGEHTFASILESLRVEEKPTREEIPGLAFQNGRKTNNRNRLREYDLDQFGQAWRPIELIKRLKNFGLVYPAPSEQTGCVTIEYSRGCLGNCPFCSSPNILGCSVSFRSAEKVCAEIETLYRIHGINSFYFCDLDFLQQGKENQKKVEELCLKLINLNLPIYFEAMGRIQSVLDTSNFELLNLMYKAGCRKIAWGLESLDPAVTKSMRKGHHGAGDDVYKVLEKSADVGILNTGLMIIGWQDFEKGIGDTKESILRDSAILPNYPLHRIRVAIGTPLPGSTFYQICREKNLLVDSDASRYDTNHLVYRHPSLSSADIYELRAHIYRTFYSHPDYKRRVEKTIAAHPEYEKLFQEFLAGIENRY